MDIATLEDQERRLVLAGFAESDALSLGQNLVTLAKAENLPVVINIRTANRTLFHAALPGSGPNNDNWARRKSNTALLLQTASMLVGLRNRQKGETLERHGLNPADYSDSGGAVPIRVRGVGVVAVATVSGLPQEKDHALVAGAIRTMIDNA